MHKRMKTSHFDKILVVDDTTANLQILTNLLMENGYTVYPASAGKLALEFVRSTLPDLILLDIQMPGMDGYEVCRRLKADERTCSIPIIFISILEDERDKVKGFQVGAVDYITKPFQPEEVLARVEIHLHLRELTEHLEQKIAERTEELYTANTRLQRELAERIQAEAGLHESEERFRRLTENAPDLIYRMSLPDGNYEFINSAVLSILGYSPEKFYNNDISIKQLIHPDWQNYFQEQWKNLLKGEIPPAYEYQCIHKSGQIRWLNQRNILVRDDTGIPIAIEGIVTDITERKQSEENIRALNQTLEQRVVERTAQLEAANDQLEAFAYSVSHDLRAPLRHINGFMEILKETIETRIDDQSRHYMDSISSAARKMDLMIEDLLSFSRMGRHGLSFKQVLLGDLVQDVILDLKPDIQKRTIDWHIGDLPSLYGDAAMLRIVLDNLISNALKFTRPKAQARIDIGSLPGQEAETIIFVRDNGVGFDMAYADKLFKVFQRLHRADEFEGTGIGLANVHRIITRHGGRIWAEGELGKGAAFYFSLPHKQQGANHETH